MSRFVRKHRAALLALAVFNAAVFFPIAFMERVVSPNDVFNNFSPWAATQPEIVSPQNPLLNDPPTAYYTLFTLVKDDWRTFHWNPYIGAGVPGFGSSAASVMTPIVLLPVLFVPLPWVYTAILFLKLNLAFLFSYLWLREEGLGKRGAAIGAVVIAGAGVYTVRWLWQITNATMFYPALLWIVRRKRTPIALVALIALAYGLSGFPAAIAYGGWVAAVYALFVTLKSSSRRVVKSSSEDASRRLGNSTTRRLLNVAAGVLLALLIAAPFLVPFAQFLKRSGYLDVRQKTSLQAVYPLSHWKSFFAPDRLGNPVEKNWTGDRALGVLDNYVECTIYLGLLAIPLAIAGLFNRRARARWFWLAAALVILACMFGVPLIAPLIAKIPGFKYSALARVALLLPLPIGYLAAAGGKWLRRYGWIVAVALAFDLGLFAGRFHPYLEPEKSHVRSTPTIDFLRAQPGPFRVAPQFDYFWPNSAELFRIEDVRSHFSSEGAYRKMLQRLDPGVWGGNSTVLQFNSLRYNFGDPLSGMLGVRYYVEHKYIDIVKWTTFGATAQDVQNLGPLELKFGDVLQRTIRIDREPFWALEVPASIEEERGRDAGLQLSLIKDGALVWSRRFTKADAAVMNKLYVPLRPYTRQGDTVTLQVRSIGVRGSVTKAENANPGESPLFYGRVTSPVVFDRELPDGRVFRNLSELPRFWPVSKLRKLNDDEFVAARDVDYATEAVITDDPVMPPNVGASDARVTLARYEPDEQRVVTESSRPFFLASSEKLTPELAVTIDGRRVKPVEINMLFAGLEVPAGRHELVFSRRIARGWWWLAVVGALLWLGVAFLSLSRALARDHR